MKITKREILFFLLGFSTLFVIEVTSDWEGHKAALRKGWEQAKSN
jgi:hypothetical protein